MRYLIYKILTAVPIQARWRARRSAALWICICIYIYTKKYIYIYIYIYMYIYILLYIRHRALRDGVCAGTKQHLPLACRLACVTSNHPCPCTF